ncbi:MAG: hypothetical protein AAGA50_22345 [Pseudomonadota bacterium]
MTHAEMIKLMEQEWRRGGFLWDLRQSGIFDVGLAEALLDKLRSFEIGKDELIPGKLVSMLWLLPTFLEA